LRDIREITIEQISTWVAEQGEPAFRGKQIAESLWKRGVRSFDEMSNLSLSSRKKLHESFSFKTATIEHESRSKDQTAKFLFSLHDKKKVEGVLIPSRERVTACISSQVGCPLGCRFCATGNMGFTRNLQSHEIFDQYLLMNQKSREYFGHDLSNLVFMGMGEPLLNYEAVMGAIHYLTAPRGIGLSHSRITLSTVGIVKEIYRLADENFRAGLAVSLHSADERIRQHLIPASKTNPLPELQTALQYYVQKTNARITFEYVLLHQVNDSLQDAAKLAHFCKSFPVKINILEYNETGSLFKSSPKHKRDDFLNFLMDKNLIVQSRRKKGEDIDAACGQLATRETEK
jgi:23S rRNA (adenine2503-C2)-methyltransferase